jgi:hypothetical protein
MLLQLRIFGFSLLEDRDVRVGVLPERQEVPDSRRAVVNGISRWVHSIIEFHKCLPQSRSTGLDA